MLTSNLYVYSRHKVLLQLLFSGSTECVWVFFLRVVLFGGGNHANRLQSVRICCRLYAIAENMRRVCKVGIVVDQTAYFSRFRVIVHSLSIADLYHTFLPRHHHQLHTLTRLTPSHTPPLAPSQTTAAVFPPVYHMTHPESHMAVT